MFDIKRDEERTILKWVLLVIAFCIAQHACLNWQVWNSSNTIISDYDVLLRILRVENLIISKDWFNDIFYRINPPDGMVVPWTHPMDILLLPGQFLSPYFSSLRDALFAWSVVLTAILYFLFIVSTIWMVRPLKIKLGAQLFMLLMFLYVGSVPSTFELARGGDHHGVVLILQALITSCLLRSEANSRWSILAGILSGFAIWTAIEGFPIFCVYGMGLGILWLVYGRQTTINNALSFASTALIICLAAMFAEHRLTDLFVIEYDRLSIVYITWMSFIVAALFVIKKINQNDRTVLSTEKKLFICIIAGVCILTAMQLIFPGFYKGPGNQVNALVKSFFLDAVDELKTVPEANQEWFFLPQTILALFALSFLIKENNNWNEKLIFIASVFVLFAAMAFFCNRWMRQSDVLAIPCASIIINYGANFFLTKIFDLFSRKKIKYIFSAIFYFLTKLLLFAGIIFIFIKAQQALTVKNETYTNTMNCMSEGLSFVRNKETNLLNSDYSLILTDINMAMPLVYWTKHSVLAANFHRNPDGFAKLYKISKTKDMSEARQLIVNTGIRSVLLCKINDRVFYPWLNLTKLPDWIEIVKISKTNSQQNASIVLLKFKF